ncbi:MAG: thiamine pyrophosphate-binding protein [Alphaproteobacteria bacterium]|nr:thiamine pyrophosphate-binding protein [Alphaproteobacteria bacterium]
MAPKSSPAAKDPDVHKVERLSIPYSTNAAAFGSDVVAETLSALDIPYIALNPGASYRGLHDSIVNFLGNEQPQMILCLHEEAAVAIAHGYAKVTGRAMAAAVHSNVGLFHATMAIFNAWCDRMPILILGATGPVDAMKRRPWIDWIHTAADQGAIIRNFSKWDDQPASAGAARESVIRAYWMANTAPCGPTYINLDAEVQEGKLAAPLPAIDVKRFMPPVVQGPSADLVKKAVDIMTAAKRPLILMGRVSRDEADWNRRVQLAEALDARVATNLKIGAVFPTDHPLHIGFPATFATDDLIAAVKDADAILSLDWVDLGGTFKAIGSVPSATIVQVSLDQNLHNGWSMDYEALPPADLFIPAETDATIAALLEAIGSKAKPKKPHLVREHPLKPKPSPTGDMAAADMANVLRHAVGDRKVSLTHVSLSWHGEFWPFRHPLDYIGSDGGGGVGGGPGISVGAALALKGTGRMPIAVCGDGDFMMGCTAVWTAVHYRIPLLVLVANNRSFYNDEVHQERVAVARNRPVDNKWIGQRISDPDIDIATVAKGQGASGFGPCRNAGELEKALNEAIKVVEGGGVAVVDARILGGYSPATAAAMSRGKADRGS